MITESLRTMGRVFGLVAIMAAAPVLAGGLLDADAALLRGSVKPAEVAESSPPLPSAIPQPTASTPVESTAPSPEDPAKRLWRIAERARKALPRGDDPVLKRLRESQPAFEQSLKVLPACSTASAASTDGIAAEPAAENLACMSRPKER
jgi:hypothetical protein